MKAKISTSKNQSTPAVSKAEMEKLIQSGVTDAVAKIIKSAIAEQLASGQFDFDVEFDIVDEDIKNLPSMVEVKKALAGAAQSIVDITKRVEALEKPAAPARFNPVTETKPKPADKFGVAAKAGSKVKGKIGKGVKKH